MYATVFCNVAKAFGWVSHNTLLKKLSSMVGIRKLVWIFLGNSLFLEKFIVKLNDSFSNYEKIEFGVLQGSILGPMFFLAYINAITNLNINSKTFLFIDGTIIAWSPLGHHISCCCSSCSCCWPCNNKRMMWFEFS